MHVRSKTAGKPERSDSTSQAGIHVFRKPEENIQRKFTSSSVNFLCRIDGFRGRFYSPEFPLPFPCSPIISASSPLSVEPPINLLNHCVSSKEPDYFGRGEGSF
jgi:hypothetical protein